MIHLRFRLVCILRVLVLCATIFLLFYLLYRTSIYAVTLITALSIPYQVYALVRYVERTNRDLNRFLEAIRYDDFSQTFIGDGLGSSYDELKAAFNSVLDKLKQTRAEKEEHYQYLQTVVQHIGIGLLSYQPNGDVELINTAAKRLLRVNRLRNIHQLESFSKALVDALDELTPGNKTLVKIQDDDELSEYIIYATGFVLRGRQFTLVSIQDIQSELEEKEMEAWQKLIRVLTHEIMNSVTPIASLASSVNDVIGEASGKQRKKQSPDVETLDEVSSAVRTIERRSQGLLHFVESYRNLTRLPRADFQIFRVSALFDRVKQLMGTQFEEKKIEFDHAVDPEDIEMTADPDLVEQILLNLLKNAMQAVEKKKDAKVDLGARLDARGRVMIQVSDNGSGILEEVQEKIFIPFFTTRKGGTGIGLALARQVMRMHRGTISVASRPDVETVFTLRF